MTASDPGEEVRISVIIPAFRASDSLGAVLEALAPQVQTPSREALLIDASGDGSASPLLAERYPWLNVVVLEEPVPPGQARNHGVALSRGEHLAFLDAHAVPSKHWLDELERAVTDAWDAVASPVYNGTPWHPVGTSAYLLEFSEWLPGRSRMPRHAAACALLVRRLYLEEVGGFDENVPLGDDTLLTYPLARRGRLGWARRAGVNRANPVRFREFLDRQERLGSAFVALSDRIDFPSSGVTRLWALPFAPLLRLAGMARSLRGSPREALQAVVYLPLILLGLLSWAVGVGKARVVPRS